MTQHYGAPTSSATPPAADAPFKLLTPYKWEWKFADTRIEVSALNYGRRGVDILEAKEVPWPVRPDAPATPAPKAAGPLTQSTR